MKEGDIETGAMRSYGGRRRSRKTKRRRVKKRKSSRTRKAGMQRPINEEHSPERTATNTSGTSYDYEANIESRDDADSVSQLNLSNLNIDDSRDSESSRYSIASMSSMGDWEVEDYEDLNKILDKIDHFINFPDRDTMKKIIKVHHPKVKEKLVKEALEIFFDVRIVDGFNSPPAPKLGNSLFRINFHNSVRRKP